MTRLFGWRLVHEDSVEYERFSAAMERIIERKQNQHRFYDVCAHEEWARRTMYRRKEPS